MQSLHTQLKLRWTGHVTRMHDERLPKKVLYVELQEGKRSQGGQKKRYKDTLKASLKDFNIPTECWKQADRSKAVVLMWSLLDVLVSEFSVMFHFMFVHYTFSSVWVAEWPTFGK